MKWVTTFLAMLIIALSQPLLAHTKAGTTVPADGAKVAAPTEIVLTFPAAVKLTALMLQNDAGNKMALGPIPTEPATSYTVAIVDALPPGRYQVSWRSISSDSHIVDGEIRFSVTD